MKELGRNLYFGLILLFALLVFLPETNIAQNIPSETKKDRKKRAETDPWAEFEDEVDSIRRWEFGINLGAYFPNKYSANFYNGIPTQENSVDYVFKNKYWYQEIKQSLGSVDTVVISGYPTNMHYQVAFTGGIFVRFNFNRKNGIYLEANYTQLNASDVVTVEVDPYSYTSIPDIRLIPIIGKEGRVLIDLGYQRSFPLKSKIYFFLQGGGLMCYTQVIHSFIDVEGIEYNLINIYGSQGYIPNTNTQTQNINQNAFGFGGYLGTGVGIPLTDMYGMELGGSMQYYPVNLKNYPDWKPSFSVYLRILIGAGKTEI
jgi:hypothetical protein